MGEAKLSDLVIHKFRGIAGAEFSSFGRANLIVGNNNSGKTSFLEALALYCAPFSISNWLRIARSRETRPALPIDALRWLFPKQDGRFHGTQPRSARSNILGSGTFRMRGVTASSREYEETITAEEMTGAASKTGNASTAGLLFSVRLRCPRPRGFCN